MGGEAWPLRGAVGSSLALVLLLAAIFLVPAPVLAAPPAAGAAVVLLDVEGVIDPIVARYVQREIGSAAASGAAAIILRLDTPGGLDSSMRIIVQAIMRSPVPVVVYIWPPGARAASAGLFIATAAHVAAMAPGTNIGAAHPVAAGAEEIPATLEDKVTNDAVAYIRALASERGRNAEWAEKAVRQSASLPARQAVEERVVDLMADDLDQLLSLLEGREVRLGERTITLSLVGSAVLHRPMTLPERLAHGLIDPNIAYLLLTIGTIAIIAELYNPGGVIPGVTGVICLLLAFVGLGSLPVNWGGIALILTAIAFFVLDIYVSGFALSVAGVISFLIGSLLLFSPGAVEPALPRIAVSRWVIGGTTAALALFVAAALGAGVRAQRRAPAMSGRLAAGAQGVALTTLAPEGVVRVQSEEWTAVAMDEPIPAGTPVEVVSVEGLRLYVRRRE